MTRARWLWVRDIAVRLSAGGAVASCFEIALLGIVSGLGWHGAPVETLLIGLLACVLAWTAVMAVLGVTAQALAWLTKP